MTTIGSLSLLIALAGFLALVACLVRGRHESWASWAASMPLTDDTPVSPNATEESA